MIIYYLAAFYPAKYKECVSANGISPAYKFNKLFAEGMANVAGTKVRCIVPRIILDKINDDDSRNRKIEVENGVEYIFLNAGRDSYVSFIKSALKELKNAKKEDNVTLICDALSVNNSLLCMMAKLRYKIRNVAIVTDLPQYVGDSNKRVLPKLFDKADLFLMKRFDKFVFLTEYMNQCLNKRCKPFCVMEGICDVGERQKENALERKHSKKVCLYAGSLHKEYGIDVLIQAFEKADVDNCELHIYGRGNYTEQIKEICAKNKKVLYCGVVPNEVIVEAERKATLLINPRPTTDEYTKYSFPSKTLEYMASGTPVLMTKLPGMPKEYYEYVYLFENESPEGYAEKLMDILHKSKEELHLKGGRAKEFVIEQKSNIAQAQRVLEQLEI